MGCRCGFRCVARGSSGCGGRQSDAKCGLSHRRAPTGVVHFHAQNVRAISERCHIQFGAERRFGVCGDDRAIDAENSARNRCLTADFRHDIAVGNQGFAQFDTRDGHGWWQRSNPENNRLAGLGPGLVSGGDGQFITACRLECFGINDEATGAARYTEDRLSVERCCQVINGRLTTCTQIDGRWDGDFFILADPFNRQAGWQCRDWVAVPRR